MMAAGHDFVTGTVHEGDEYRGVVTRECGSFIALRLGAITRELFTPRMYADESEALAAADELAGILTLES